MGRVSILILSPISVGLLQVCLHLISYWLLVCSKLLLLCLGMGLEFLISLILLTWRVAVFCQMLFLHLMIMWFYFFEFVYIVDYTNGFSNIKPTLCPWVEAYLIVVSDGFDVFLDSVCKNFIEYFCIDIDKWYWLEVLFLGWVLVWFSNKSNCFLLEWVW